jgi:hypothetical protein
VAVRMSETVHRQSGWAAAAGSISSTATVQ